MVKYFLSILIAFNFVFCFSQNEQNFKPPGGGGGTGDINQNGNSFGTAINLGTNDNFGLNLETNNTMRLSINSNGALGGDINQYSLSSLTTSPNTAYTLHAGTSNTAGSRFGSQFLFRAHSNNGTMQDQSVIESSWRVATDATRSGQIYFKFVNGGSGPSDYFRFTGENNGTFVVGDASPLTITRSAISAVASFQMSGQSFVNISSSAASAAAINIFNTSSLGGIYLNGQNHTSTNPGSLQFVRMAGDKGATSTGSNSYTGLALEHGFTQSGGHTGITRGLYINNALSGVYDYRAIDITANAGCAIHQSGASSMNKFMGKTNFGSTTAPVCQLQVTAGRFAQAKGANVNSATTMTLGSDGNVFNINLSSSFVNNIISTNWPAGSIIYLVIKGNMTFSHNNGVGGGTSMLLAGSINYSAVNNSVLTLLYDGTNWQEVSRKHP